MPSPSNTDFPYHRVADDLRNAVLDGTLGAGQQLRSEWEMAEQYATSRPTVRRAVALLKAEGLLVARQGRGTYVRPAPPVRLTVTAANYTKHRASGRPGFDAQVIEQGHRARQVLLDVENATASDLVAERLGLTEGNSVVIRRRLFLVNDEPVALCESYFDAELVRGTPIGAHRLIRGGAITTIEALRGPVRRTVDDLTARMPTRAEREVLHLGTGSPVVVVSRLLYGGDGRAVELQETVAAADRHRFRYEVDL